MKKILIGGSFDPPHRDHLSIAKRVQELGFVPIFVPTWQNNQKHSSSTFEDRLAMTKMLGFEVLDVEKEIRTGYAIDLINYLILHGWKDINFLIGYDQANNIRTWKDYDVLLSLAKFYVISRKGFSLNKDLDARITTINYNSLGLSSSNIREEIGNGSYKKADKKINDEVFKYIKEKKLYI